MMRTAVENDCANFLRLLLEHGVSLRQAYPYNGLFARLYSDVRFKLCSFIVTLKIVTC